jgi:hypothetical protein
MNIDRSPAVHRPGIDRSALMDRLGDVAKPPPAIHSWLSRAAMADRLPQLVGLDQQNCYRLCVEVVRRIRPRRTK